MYDNETYYFMPIYPDQKPPKERTGCGDAFSTTFASFVLKGMSKVESLSRAPVINEDDLVSLLKEGRLSGVGLDVFEEEPKFNKTLKKFDRVLLTPHIASASIEARGAMSCLCAENILDVFAGKSPKNQVE